MFVSNVKKIMKNSGIKTVNLSQQTGLSSATIAKARSDSGIAECRLSTLGRIANALEVPMKELFDGEYEQSDMTMEEQEAAAHSRR